MTSNNMVCTANSGDVDNGSKSDCHSDSDSYALEVKSYTRCQGVQFNKE